MGISKIFYPFNYEANLKKKVALLDRIKDLKKRMKILENAKLST